MPQLRGSTMICFDWAWWLMAGLYVVGGGFVLCEWWRQDPRRRERKRDRELSMARAEAASRGYEWAMPDSGAPTAPIAGDRPKRTGYVELGK